MKYEPLKQLTKNDTQGTDRRKYTYIKGGTGGRTDGWMDGWMDGCRQFMGR
jgi:hypothetical protein